jgi:hypothetical protein
LGSVSTPFIADDDTPITTISYNDTEAPTTMNTDADTDNDKEILARNDADNDNLAYMIYTLKSHERYQNCSRFIIVDTPDLQPLRF